MAYYSSTSLLATPDHARGISFLFGTDMIMGKTGAFLTRAVRGGV